MVRGERVKIIRQDLTGVSNTDYKTSEIGLNGTIEQILIDGIDIEYDLNIKSTNLSGLSVQNILDVQATGNNVYYPRVAVMNVSGTAASAGDNLWGKIVVDDKLDFDATVLATGSKITVRVYYI